MQDDVEKKTTIPLSSPYFISKAQKLFRISTFLRAINSRVYDVEHKSAAEGCNGCNEGYFFPVSNRCFRRIPSSISHSVEECSEYSASRRRFFQWENNVLRGGGVSLSQLRQLTERISPNPLVSRSQCLFSGYLSSRSRP